MGRTNPKLVLDGIDFRLQKKVGNTTVWLCSFYYRTKCKCRLKTTGNIVIVQSNHNHEPAEINLKYLVPRTVVIVRNLEQIDWMDIFMALDDSVRNFNKVCLLNINYYYNYSLIFFRFFFLNKYFKVSLFGFFFYIYLGFWENIRWNMLLLPEIVQGRSRLN